MTRSPQFDHSQWIDLANPRLSAEVIYATDDFFAPKERLIQATEPVFKPDVYDDHGKWMDGWESRRKRGGGHDHCVVRLGLAGVIKGIDIDTRHFTGNFPPEASLEACTCEGEPVDTTAWHEVVARSPLQGDAHNVFAVDDERPWTHVRLHIFPDGGVARLRVFGEVRGEQPSQDGNDPVDLVAMRCGGRAIACSDEHYGSMQNLVLPGPSLNMGDGWETRRRRGPGNDWVILKLGRPGKVTGIELDTAYFKGNYPDRASIDAVYLKGNPDAAELEKAAWSTLLPEQRLDMDKAHFFESEINDVGVISYVRVNIFPDGGVARVRLIGMPQAS